MPEKHYRLNEVSKFSGYKESTLRKKVQRGELAYRKVGRIITVPESEVNRLLGKLTAAVPADGAA